MFQGRSCVSGKTAPFRGLEVQCSAGVSCGLFFQDASSLLCCCSGLFVCFGCLKKIGDVLVGCFVLFCLFVIETEREAKIIKLQ